MIKLNNKNITYVALADTNNSLKAPKEIWYADSNNSVKLVYRRKDALIEGEDYEKYHWLIGDGSAYINTNHNVNEDLEYETKCILPENGTYLMWYRTAPNNPLMIVKNSLSSKDEGRVRISNISSIVRLTPFTDLEITTDGTSIEINGTSYTVTKELPYDMPLRLFHAEVEERAMPEVQNNYTTNGVKCAYFRFKDTNSITIQNLIPCKLLKPVPKWLDANGIRRQVGECGMIDLISGKFYGNVNSVGTFTVENYYERKEWLVGDGSAYIDTDIIVDVPSLYINTSFTKKVGGQDPLFGSRNSVNSNGSHIWYMSNGKLRLDIVTNEGNWIYIESNDVQNINQLIVDCPNKVININEITVQSEVDDLSIKNSSNTFKIFSLEVLGKDANTGNTPYNGAFGNFILNDSTHSLNLIPCTLTMDLPASMDANNTPRTKGTSGMWDLVSDRFYGNVANSGTFKAVNLAEGVDYEVHQWLKGDSRAYIDTNIIVNSSTLILSIKCKTPSNGALCGSRNGANLNSDTTAIHYQNGRYRLDILSVGNNYVFVDKSNSEDTFDIDLASNTAVVNGTSFTSSKNHTNSINTFRVFGCSSATVGYGGYINKFILNDGYNNLDLIPVKLLRSIPSKYDANGIARQAGECGMYDTVNDKFYGNVANSGTFSVSDDS